MTQGLKSIVPAIAMIAVLAMAPVAPEAGNTLFLIAGGLALVLMWPNALTEFPRPIVWMPLAGLLLLGIAYGISAGKAGLAGLLYFAPLLAVWPLVTLMRLVDRTQFTLLLGVLALCGATGAALVAIDEVQATGATRAGLSVANPIHFADVALLVGFMALVGCVSMRSSWRWIFLLAPIMAMVAVLLSGTRGAIVAFVAMVGVAVVVPALLRLYPRRVTLVAGLALLGIAALFLAFGGSQISGVQRILADISDILVSGAPTDDATTLRFQMYQGALRAFLESPIVGHGPLAFTDVADSLADTSFGGAPHLHNDLADMAASAGIFGLVAYLLFVLAPLVEILSAPQTPRKSAGIVLVATWTAGFLVMGVTNATFGILTVTVAFAAICVISGLLATQDETLGQQSA
jgi:O-antigen ligase